MGSWNGVPTLSTFSEPTAAEFAVLTGLAGVTAETYFAYKANGQTVNNSATLVNDNDLILPVVAGATYQFVCYVVYNSNSTANWKALWSVPSGATMSYMSIGNAVGGTFSCFHNTAATTQAAGGTGADRPYLMHGLIIMSATPGNALLTWAQNTANASNTIVQSGSYLLLTRVA